MPTNRTDDTRLADLVRKAHAVRREIEERHQPVTLSWDEAGWRTKKHEIIYRLSTGERRGLADTHDGTPLGRGKSRVRIFEALLFELKIRQGEPRAVAARKKMTDYHERIAARPHPTDEDLGGDLDV